MLDTQEELYKDLSNIEASYQNLSRSQGQKQSLETAIDEFIKKYQAIYTKVSAKENGSKLQLEINDALAYASAIKQELDAVSTQAREEAKKQVGRTKNLVMASIHELTLQVKELIESGTFVRHHHYFTWQQLKPEIAAIKEEFLKTKASKEKIRDRFTQDEIKANPLLAILFLNDNEFKDYVIDIGIDTAELALLAYSRLEDIQAHKQMGELKIAQEKNFQVDPEELEHEIYKLAVHANLNPDSKTLLLGSASPLLSYHAELQEQGKKAMYLNCADPKWSWGLNRAYLEAAINMGYEIKLVEQHFPEIEKVLRSGKSSDLIIQLLREARKNSPDAYSQYHGQGSPTATPMELLYLLDIGCKAEKQEDGSLVLKRPSVRTTDDIPTRGRARVGSTQTRSHSEGPAPSRASKPPTSTVEMLKRKPGEKLPDSVKTREDQSKDVAQVGQKILTTYRNNQKDINKLRKDFKNLRKQIISDLPENDARIEQLNKDLNSLDTLKPDELNEKISNMTKILDEIHPKGPSAPYKL